jgi:hypothetical protein
VLVLGSASAVSGGTDPAAAAAAGYSGRRRGGAAAAKASSSTAAGGGGAAGSVCPPAHELAWGYDLVITTFQRLSNDWSVRGNPQLAERLVLLKVRARGGWGLWRGFWAGVLRVVVCPRAPC